jgi:hypothetical protein
MTFDTRPIGEGTIAALFPTLQSSFVITFYGTQEKGNAYLQFFKEDGIIIASAKLTNVTNGPYGFKFPIANVKGFTLHNDDVGGLAIYEIRYGTPEEESEPYFLDTFDFGAD